MSLSLSLRHPKHWALAVMVAVVAIGQGCASEEDKDGDRKPELSDIPGHDGLGVDSRRTQGPRTMAAEPYLHSYMALFGASSPNEVATLAKGADGKEMFETWGDHIGALGLPDYGSDIARASDTNALMLGAYERLGMALCERAAERDLRATGSSAGTRIVFDFALPSNPLDRASFDAGFDVLHRTTLGYPARLAPASRSEAFFKLYSTVVGTHGQAGVTSRLSPAEAGWATVCEGLLRHPEFHLY